MKLQLNTKQEEAKNCVEGPLLIIAGAGSGKTATLTARVEYMISQKNIDPSSILMVTFTNKAAGEMKERVAKVLNAHPPRSLFASRNFPAVGTFHSIGIFMLKTMLDPKHPPLTPPSQGGGFYNYYEEICEHLNLRKDFVIYDESDKLSVLKSIIKNDLQLTEKEFPARQIGSYISNAKNELITAAQYEKEVDSQIKEVVWKTFVIYEKRLRQNNAMDFDDILVKALHLLHIPRVLEYYQDKYRYLMIDEYQDTNAPQYNIVKLLALKYNNLAVVGDDSQSIYSWRGANMQNIINFRKDYPSALIIKLEQNYRSTKNIIAAANQVINKNTSGIKKELWTDNMEGEKITYIEAPDDKLEAKIICDIIKKREKDDDKSSFSDNLILYRTNAQSRKLEEALMIANIPYRVIGGQKFYDRKEIKDILCYLKTIFNPDDIVAIKRVINTPTRKIGPKSIETLDMYRENFGLSYLAILENADEIEELKPAAKKALIAFNEMYREMIAASSTMVVTDLIKKILELTGYIAYLTEGLSQEEKDSKIENIDELINVASEYNGMDPRESLSTFLEEVALITDMDTKDERTEYVTLMTIHTSKGLEEKRVFLTGFEDSIFPSFRSVSDNQALEEERRLLYVAMTRAREELYISRAIERFTFGDYVRNPVSRFFKEIPKEYLEDHIIELSGNNPFASSGFGSMLSGNSQGFSGFGNSDSIGLGEREVKIKVPASNDVSDFKRGDRVSHPKFGGGLITALNGEIAEIAFSGKGIKKMNIKIAPVRKL